MSQYGKSTAEYRKEAEPYYNMMSEKRPPIKAIRRFRTKPYDVKGMIREECKDDKGERLLEPTEETR